ncbi:MAG: type II toxin-antitoxin system RelE/ParE family toxin [Steroidobacteraceae bacterium]|nr:type II toxin-antitoxin system RelE/ParE family toxin [Deltaproteobacteria bacterium]
MIIEWLPAAERDFNTIVDFIADDNPVAAIEQGDEIEQQIAGLIEHRQRGRAGRVKGTRELVIVRTPFIAAYRIKRDKIQILRIFHGAQQWPDSF